jgi:peroxiredoxin
MNRLAVGDPAPDFALPDHQGLLVRLSDSYQTQNVLLVFNLGFI